MHPQQLALAMAIVWLVFLITAPFLIAKARSRAFDLGVDAGKRMHKAELKLQIRALAEDLSDARAQNDADLRKHHKAVAVLQETIGELQSRIMSYTGVAVTKTDHDNLVSALSTMRLAQRTFKALKTETEAARAAAQADVLDDLAKRIHAQLRITPASAANAGAAA